VSAGGSVVAWCLFIVSIDGFGVRRSHRVSEGVPEWDCAIVVSLESAVLLGKCGSGG
jgi:hypothetical protein